MASPEIDRLQAAIAVLLDLLTILYRESPEKEKILAAFEKETESFSSELLFSPLQDEYLSMYEDYRKIVLRLLTLQRPRS